MQRIIFLIIVAFLTIMPSIAGAERFIEPYAGVTFTMEEDADVSASGGGFTLAGEFRDVDFDESAIFGLRAGRWLESVENLGFAVDVFGFQPDVESQTATFSGTGSVNAGNGVVVATGSAQAQINSLDLKVLGFSADIMLRLMPPDRTPTTLGEVHAYVLAGPALFLAELESETDAVFGIKAGAGLSWMLTPHTGLFAEYRFTHFSPDLELSSGGVKMDFDADISTHHIIVGLTFRF